MLLSELLREDVIKIGLEAVGKWEAIEELVDLLIAAHELRLNDREEVIEAVFSRERSLSTGLGHGLAVPHGAVESVMEVIAALGTSRQGIPFDSLDGGLAHIVVLLVLPKGSLPRHVSTLAGIAALTADPRLSRRILRAERPSQVMEALLELETGAAKA